MMPTGAKCPKCGAGANPGVTQCQYCGTPIAQGAPQGPAYGANPYGAPGGYGAPPPQQYGAPGGYGAPQPYGQPPNPYGNPNPYGGPVPQPQPFQPQVVYRQSGFGHGGFWSTYWMIRLVVAVIAISVSVGAACLRAAMH